MSLKKQRIFTLMICMAVFISAFAGVIVPNADAAADSELRLVCVNDKTPLSGMKWKIYRVGELVNGEYVLSGDFAQYHVDLIDMSKENISAAAQTLESYAIADRKTPTAASVADNDGEVSFKNIESGLYLALGSLYEAGPYYYDPSPILVDVGEKTVTSYDAYPKIERATLTEEVASYTVRKVWLDNDDSYEVRPVYVTVDIYKDEELFKTVTLNEANNWQYRWECENKLTEWLVIEREIPAEYEVRIEYNEKQYLIRNRHNSVENWGDIIQTTTAVTGNPVTTVTTTDEVTGKATGSNPDTDGSITTSYLSTSTSSTSSTKQNSVDITTQKQSGTGGGKLPQTGQLWWPVIPLIFGGALFIAVGLMLRPKKDRK